jgi:hypothetical protein
MQKRLSFSGCCLYPMQPIEKTTSLSQTLQGSLDISTLGPREVSMSTDCISGTLLKGWASELRKHVQTAFHKSPAVIILESCAHVGDLCAHCYGWVLLLYIASSDLGLLSPSGDSLFFLVPATLFCVDQLKYSHKISLVLNRPLGTGKRKINFNANRRNWPDCKEYPNSMWQRDILKGNYPVKHIWYSPFWICGIGL